MALNKRKPLALYFYGWFVIFMVVRYVDGLLLYQIGSNPVRSPRVDPVVWMAQYVGVPEWMSEVSIVFDLTILFLALLIIYRVLNNKVIHTLAGVLVVMFSFYIMTIYCFPTLSIRKYLGLILLPIAFTFKSHSRYSNYLELMRYYVLFIFTSASLWKIVRGVAFDVNHMQQSLKAQHIDNMINWPDHLITNIISSIIDHPTLCYIIFLLAIFSQLSFAVGFFTKKYDKILAFLLIVFIVSDYLVMRIEYWEFIVFLPLFLGKTTKSIQHQ